MLQERSFMINKRLAGIYHFSLAPPKSRGEQLQSRIYLKSNYSFPRFV